MDVQDAIQQGAVNLIGTATAFGQGYVASAISGNPYYSNDPAAAGYATNNGLAPQTATVPALGLLVMLAGFAYVILKR